MTFSRCTQARVAAACFEKRSSPDWAHCWKQRNKYWWQHLKIIFIERSPASLKSIIVLSLSIDVLNPFAINWNISLNRTIIKQHFLSRDPLTHLIMNCGALRHDICLISKCVSLKKAPSRCTVFMTKNSFSFCKMREWDGEGIWRLWRYLFLLHKCWLVLFKVIPTTFYFYSCFTKWKKKLKLFCWFYNSSLTQRSREKQKILVRINQRLRSAVNQQAKNFRVNYFHLKHVSQTTCFVSIFSRPVGFLDGLPFSCVNL